MQELTEIYEISFQIIADAGDARSLAMNAIKKANEYRFEEANDLIRQAQNSLRAAHASQTGLMQKQANGESVEINIMLVHSQDHFAMGTCAIDMAKQAIIINQKIKGLEVGSESGQSSI
ncbi:MAG: PTS lactose/cellobiose transporter subunit IIA [Lachnospiraceae bacterium]